MKKNNLSELNTNEVVLKEITVEEMETLEESVTPSGFWGFYCGGYCVGLGCW